MKRLRVLLLSSWYPDGGDRVSGVFVQDQATVLSRVAEVRVLHPRATSLHRWLRGQAGPAARADVEGPVTVHRTRAVAATPRLARLAHGAALRAAARGIERILRSGWRPDVLHAHVVLPAGLAAAAAGARHGIPVLLTEHSGPFRVHLEPPWRKAATERALFGARRVLAVSPSLAGEIRAAFPALAPEVVGNVVRDDLFTPAPESAAAGAPASGPGAADRPPTLLCVAALVPGKGVGVLLDAFAALAAEARLVVVGEGPERAALESRARALGVAERVRFAAGLDRVGLRDAMRACDVFVLPSLHESFGLVAAEALACGRPVVATRCGGPEFVVAENCGTLVAPGDAAALADALRPHVARRGAYDPQFLRASVVARFGIDAWTRRMREVYASVAGWP